LAPVVLLIVGLSACNNSTDDAADTTAAPATTVAQTTTTTGATTTTAPATTVPLEGLGPFEVTMSVVSHETTQDIAVFAPDADGSWAVVYLIPGAGSGEDLAEMAIRLASHGTVVFAPDYRSNDSMTKQEQDLECGYRYARSIASEYGGDLDQPVTMIGDSYGASLALAHGAGKYVGYDVCFAEVERPDVVVPIAGCYYEFEGGRVLPIIDMMVDGIENATLEPHLVLVVGENDDTCHAWQSEDAVEALQAAGYDARLIVVPDGDHGNVVFWAEIDGEWVTDPNHPVGLQVVQIILDAIEDSN
jgi:acetyl esterase/lipase